MSTNPKSYTLKYLADYVGAELVGDGSCEIVNVATLQAATPGKLSFLANRAYRKFLSETQASAVLISKADLSSCTTNALVVDNPYYAYACIAKLFEKNLSATPGIHPTAVVSDSAQIHPTCSIGPFCSIGDNVIIDEGTIIGASCIIEEDVKIGKSVRLWPRVTLYSRTEIGDRVVMHSGVVIGADGFGFAFEKGHWHKVPQLGKVKIGDDVDIGANTTIDCGTLEDTIIEDGVKMDNQVMIGHNVKVGAHTIIAGCAGIAGSAVIGRYCAIGGASAVNGHVTIADKVQITGMTGVTRSLPKPGVYSSGTGIQPNATWRKNVARFYSLDELVRQIQRLHKQLLRQKEEL